MRMAVIVCGVLSEETSFHIDGLDHIVHVRELEQGLHNEPDKLRREVQATIDAIEAEHAPDAIVLGYGLCSRGTEGLRCKRARLVLPRAHDCITIFLGSKERYQAYQDEHPGTYWYSPGWNATGTQPGPDREALKRAEYGPLCEDEEDLQDMLEMESGWMAHYDRVAYTDLGAGDCAAACDYSRNCARHLGWDFLHVPGDPSLFRDLLLGNWDEERFLVCEPGQQPKMSNDKRIVVAVPAEET